MLYLSLFWAQDGCIDKLKSRFGLDEEEEKVDTKVDLDEDGHASIDSGGDDCDDENPNVNPSFTEICDDIDNDCDEEIDEDVKLSFFADDDGDGFPNDNEILDCEGQDNYIAKSNVTQFDCDDTNEEINPSTDEMCDGIDNNCDEQIDDETSIDQTVWHWDADGDGFAVQENVLVQCYQPENYIFVAPIESDNLSENTEDDTATTDTGDIDDDSGMDEVPDTGIEEQETEDIPHALNAAIVDCDDSNPLIYPNAIEYCDDIDWDCDGISEQPNTITIFDNENKTAVTSYFEIPMQTSEVLEIEGLTPEDNTWVFCPGTYHIEMTVDTSASFQTVGEVVWDGNGNTTPLTISSPEDALPINIEISDISIQNGLATLPHFFEDVEETSMIGGGIACTGNTNLILQNISFVGNHADRGGAIYSSDSCNIEIMNGQFFDNTGDYGAALYVSGDTTISSTSFENNNAEPILGQGGAIYADGSRVIQTLLEIETEFHNHILQLHDATFTFNSANQGAGIFSDDMQIVIEESNFHQNTATTGAGIYQRASQTSILSSFIEENEADIGSAFYLADSTSQLQNRLSCSDGSYIMSNISENTSAAVSIDGDSLLLIEDCFFGSNVSENTNDIQHQEALLMSSISLGWEGHCDAWSCMEQEACNQGLDSNYNGLIGWDDPTCQFELTQNIIPNQLIADIYDPPFSCYDSSATILQGPDVLQLYTAPTSGCIHVTTDFQEQYGSLISLFDEEQNLLTCVDGGMNSAPIVEESLLKDDEISILTSLYDNVENAGSIGVELVSGYDCDNNCCYDILLTDQFEFGGGFSGDGWNGAVLEIYEEGTFLSSVTLDESTENWTSFCIASGSNFSIYYNDDEQEPYAYLDTEGFSIYQGETELCTIQDPVLGWINDCPSQLTCQ